MIFTFYTYMMYIRPINRIRLPYIYILNIYIFIYIMRFQRELALPIYNSANFTVVIKEWISNTSHTTYNYIIPYNWGYCMLYIIELCLKLEIYYRHWITKSISAYHRRVWTLYLFTFYDRILIRTNEQICNFLVFSSITSYHGIRIIIPTLFNIDLINNQIYTKYLSLWVSDDFCCIGECNTSNSARI